MGLEKDGTGEGWQPIESAPKDGAFVLLYFDRKVWQFEAEDGRLGIGFWATDGSDEWCWSECASNSLEETGQHPTHWHPLPDPPQATAGDWQSCEGVLLKLQTLTDYEPTDAEIAALSPEQRGVVKGWRMRGEALAAGAKATLAVLREHHDWHLAQGEVACGDVVINQPEAYQESSLCDRTLAALASPLAGSAEAGGVSDAEVEAATEYPRIDSVGVRGARIVALEQLNNPKVRP